MSTRRLQTSNRKPARGSVAASRLPGRRANSAWLAGGAGVMLLGSIVGVVLALAALLVFVAGEGRAPPLAETDLEADALTVDPPSIELGRVRLDVAATSTVRLVNRSRRTVYLGRPTVETLEGC